MPQGYKQSESSLNKKVVKWLNSLPYTTAKKKKAGPGEKGELDITGCTHGFRIELEGKVGDNKPTPIQYHTIERWTKVMAITGWFNSFEIAKKLVLSQAAEKGIKF